jgi:hypothetical protein
LRRGCGLQSVFAVPPLDEQPHALVSSYMRASCILDDCTLLLLDRHKHQWED